MIRRELQYSLRTLRKNPAFTAAVVSMLAIGIGANAAIMGVIDRLLLRPLPFKDQDRVVFVENSWPLFHGSPNEEALRSPDDGFEQLAKYELGRVTLGGGAVPDVIKTARITENFFAILGVSPQLGYFFSTSEGQAAGNKVVLISHGLWQSLFNEEARVVGRSVTLNGRSFTITGVMPPDFRFFVHGENTDAWIPLVPDDPLIKSAQVEGSGTISRLRAGISLEQAQSRTDVIFQRMRQQRPELRLSEKDRIRLIPLREYWFGDLRSPLRMLLAAAVCLLLIACANTTSLMLARTATRQKDIAIRFALGAGRMQMIYESLIESLLLGIMGSALGLLTAHWGIKAMLAISPTRIPHGDEIGINFRMVCFAFAIALPAAAVSGLISVWRISRLDLNGVLNEGSGRSGGFLSARLRKLLVTAEVALTVVLLINAGLLLKSFRGLQSENLGFDTHNVLTLEITPSETKYPDKLKRLALYQQIVNRLHGQPGVAHVGMVNYLPIFSGSLIIPINLQERTITPEMGLSWSYRIASSDYFPAMGIPSVAGRGFTEADGIEAPRVAILDQSAAAVLSKNVFPNENIIGKHLILNLEKPTTFEIIGIVGDIRQQGLGIPMYPGFYLHAAQRPPPVSNLVIRTTSNPSNSLSALRNAISEVDKDLPVGSLRLMEKQVTESVSQRRFAAFLAGILGAAALLLSVVGLFGLMSHIVSHRAHEFGVRLALGAQMGDVLKLVLKQGLSLVAIGLGVGLIAALAVTRLVGSLLFGVSTTDPATFAAVTLIFFIVAFLACYIPARRAMKVDPIEALRCE